MSTAKEAWATGSVKCAVYKADDYEQIDRLDTVVINRDDLDAETACAMRRGEVLVPLARVAERIKDIRNTSRYGKEV